MTLRSKGVPRQTATVKGNPAFTSVIGSMKGQNELGLSVHESAALTIVGGLAVTVRGCIGADGLA